jgi:hypothetical protein
VCSAATEESDVLYTAQRSIQADFTPLFRCLTLTSPYPPPLLTSLFSHSSGVTAVGWRKEILEDLAAWFIKVRSTLDLVLVLVLTTIVE